MQQCIISLAKLPFSFIGWVGPFQTAASGYVPISSPITYVSPQSCDVMGTFPEHGGCTSLTSVLVVNLGFWKSVTEFLHDSLCNCTWEDQAGR